MFHVKHFGTIAGAGFARKIMRLKASGERITKLCAYAGGLFRVRPVIAIYYLGRNEKP